MRSKKKQKKNKLKKQTKKVSVFSSVTAETKRLLNGQEGRQVDFKANANALDSEDIVAFANSEGGTILLGVSELMATGGLQKGEIVGCKVDDKSRLTVINKALGCLPPIDVDIRTEGIKTKTPIFRIDIPKGTNKPYSTSSGLYKIRSEGRNVGIDPSLMKTMILTSESDEFVRRFRLAADEVIKELRMIRDQLVQEIEIVRVAAESAHEVAEIAASAAQEAADAASEAGAAAEQAASGEY